MRALEPEDAADKPGIVIESAQHETARKALKKPEPSYPVKGSVIGPSENAQSAR